MVRIHRRSPCPPETSLYLLLFASKHPKGKEFWAKAMKGVLPMEFDVGS